MKATPNPDIPPSNSVSNPPSILSIFDFSAIEEMDPNFCIIILIIVKSAEGHKLIFDKEVPFEIHLEIERSEDEINNNNNMNINNINDKDVQKSVEKVNTNEDNRVAISLEKLKTRIFIIGEETSPLHVRIELSSEHDLFFYYVHEYTVIYITLKGAI